MSALRLCASCGKSSGARTDVSVKMTRVLTAVVVAGLVAVSASEASAQQQPPPPAGRGGRGVARGAPPDPNVMSAGEVERYFDNWVVIEARRQLALDDGLYFKLGPALERLQQLRR